jgi:hypothetical protein
MTGATMTSAWGKSSGSEFEATQLIVSLIGFPGFYGIVVGVGVLTFIWLVVWLRTQGEAFHFDARGETGAFEKLLANYLDIEKFMIGLASGSIVLLVGSAAFHSAGRLRREGIRSSLGMNQPGAMASGRFQQNIGRHFLPLARRDIQNEFRVPFDGDECVTVVQVLIVFQAYTFSFLPMKTQTSSISTSRTWTKLPSSLPKTNSSSTEQTPHAVRRSFPRRSLRNPALCDIVAAPTNCFKEGPFCTDRDADITATFREGRFRRKCPASYAGSHCCPAKLFPSGISIFE